MKKKKMVRKTRVFYFTLVMILLLIGITFAFFSANFIGQDYQIIDIKGLVFRYNEAKQGISLISPEPLSDEDGMKQNNYFDFNIYIENDYKYAITYNIYLKELANNNIDKKYVKIYLTDQNDNQVLLPTSFSNLINYPNDTDSSLLYTTTIEPSSTGNKTHYYRLRIWLDEDYEEKEVIYETNDSIQTGTVPDRTFGFKVNVDNLTYEADTEKPVITSAISTDGATSTRKQIFVTATDNVGVTAYIIKNNSTIPTLDENWQTSTSTSFASDSIYSNGTYYVFAKDGSNNISDAYSVEISGVDISNPICTWTGPDVNNIASGEKAKFILTCIDDDLGEWIDNGISSRDIIVSNSNIVQISEPVKEVLTDQNGFKYTFDVTARDVNGSTSLKAKAGIVRDSSGNRNEVTEESNSLTVLNLTKLKGAVTINNGDNYTTSNNVNLTINASGATNMCISESNNKNTNCATGSSNWESYATSKSYTLSGDDGLKDVYVYFDNNTIGSDNITLDKTAPVCSITQENEDIWTSSKTITINADDETSGINPNGYSFDNSNYSSIIAKYITTNGTYTAYVKDNVGNIGNCSTTVSKIDTTSPVISTASYTDVSGTSYLSYTASDDLSGLSGYYISTNNTTPNKNDSGWVSASESNVVTNVEYISSNNYYVFVKDLVGNISAYFLVGRDTIPPTCIITATPEGQSAIKTLTITSTDKDLAAAPYSFDGSSYTTTNQKDITVNAVYNGYVKDIADNVGTCSITVTGLDTEAPTVVASTVGGKGTATITANIKDNTGVVGYTITSSSSTPTEWTNISSTPETNTTFTKTSAGTYYIHAIDSNNNVGYTTVKLSLTRNNNCTCQTYKQSCVEECVDTTCKEYDTCAACGCASYNSWTYGDYYNSGSDVSESEWCNPYGCYQTTCTRGKCYEWDTYSPYCCRSATAYCGAYKSCSKCECLEYNQSCSDVCHDTNTCQTYNACWLS